MKAAKAICTAIKWPCWWSATPKIRQTAVIALGPVKNIDITDFRLRPPRKRTRRTTRRAERQARGLRKSRRAKRWPRNRGVPMEWTAQAQIHQSRSREHLGKRLRRPPSPIDVLLAFPDRMRVELQMPWARQLDHRGFSRRCLHGNGGGHGLAQHASGAENRDAVPIAIRSHRIVPSTPTIPLSPSAQPGSGKIGDVDAAVLDIDDGAIPLVSLVYRPPDGRMCFAKNIKAWDNRAPSKAKPISPTGAPPMASPCPTTIKTSRTAMKPATPSS